MRRYFLWIRGVGKGCDYTHGCNQNTFDFEAESDKEALEKAYEIFQEYGNDNAYIPFKEMRLFKEEISVPLFAWQNEEEIEAAKRAAPTRNKILDLFLTRDSVTIDELVKLFPVSDNGEDARLVALEMLNQNIIKFVGNSEVALVRVRDVE